VAQEQRGRACQHSANEQDNADGDQDGEHQCADVLLAIADEDRQAGAAFEILFRHDASP
jgi:hypothetical protein